MKIDLKKNLKEFYNVSGTEPVLVTVPTQKIISVSGKGDPNTSTEFKDAVESLFPVAYKIKFASKEAGKDYGVMPLEGLWWAKNMKDFVNGNRSSWNWKIFIVQPDFITQDIFSGAIKNLKATKKLPALDKIIFETISEGLAAQIMHTGPFSNEGPTIVKLHNFIDKLGYSFDGLLQKHHEIYLSDMRKAKPEKMKTILRQPVTK